MKKFLDVLAVLTLGAAALSCFDPAPPRRRPAGRPRPRASAEAPSARRDGAPADAASPPREDDEHLRERLRERLGRVGGPSTVDVEVQGGAVRLRGRVPADAVDRLTSLVWSTPGVESIENRLAVER